MLRTKALLIALVAASADAANLRASEPRRLAGHGGHDDGDCHDDPEWCIDSVLNRASTASRRPTPTTQAPQEPRAGV